MQTSPQELAEYIALGYELHGVEFKAGLPCTDKDFFARVARAVLGMANRRDGGRVIIGVEERGKKLVAAGVAAQHLKTWNQDDASAALGEFADPYITINLQVVQLDGLDFVVLNVSEFEEVPVLARRDYKNVIRRGALYVRTRRKPETSEVPSQTEMRDVLEIATIKAVRRFLGAASAIGLLQAGKDDADRFRDQLDRLFE